MGVSSNKSGRRRVKPASTPEGRENQLISLAFDLAEKQLLNETASSQVITHLLKLGSIREKLEQQKLLQENLLLAAKIEAMAAGQRIEELYKAALSAMRTYSGSNDQD